MTEVVTISAGDIARLGGVGRAAVSNWRRRHADFPRPVGGSPSSPRYDAAAVESWLRRNGKAHEIPALERVWLQLCAEGGEIGLGHVVGRAGALIVWLRDGDDRPLLPGVAERADARFVELLDEVARRYGPVEAFERLYARYVDSHGRQLAVTAPDVAALMLELAGPAPTVLDPACGTGSLLVASAARRLLGQDVAPDRALIAATRLRLRLRPAECVSGDSLRDNGFPDGIADAVVCDPPSGDRDWGRQELGSDPRWEYGVPPRGESVLAWVQHCLALAKPGGRVVVRMPAAAAARRSGRAIRATLVRRGALRAVVGIGTDTDLWVLRRPAAGDPAPSRIVLCDKHSAGDLWARIDAGSGHDVDELTPDTDLRPRRRAEGGGRFDYRVDAATLRTSGLRPPALRPRRSPVPTVSLAELEQAGHISVVRTGPARPGDVVAAGPASRVVQDETDQLPAHLLYRCDADEVDPDLLAALLRTIGTGPAEQRRARLPQLPIEQQRACGRALRTLSDLRADAHALAAAADALADAATAALLRGTLRPE